MTETAQTAVAPARQRVVSWEDPMVSAGRRVITAAGEITGPDGTLYAHATTTCLVLELRSARPARENGDGR